MGGSPWSLRCRNCLEQRSNNNVKSSPKCIYFSDLFWLISKFSDRKSKSAISFRKCDSRTGLNFVWKSVKSKNIINSSYINHIYPLGNLLLLALSVTRKVTQPKWFHFSIITKQIQFVTPWFVMHSDWLRRCWKGASWVCTWTGQRIRTPHLLPFVLPRTLQGFWVVVRDVDGHSYCTTDLELLAWNYYQGLGKQNWSWSTS